MVSKSWRSQFKLALNLNGSSKMALDDMFNLVHEMTFQGQTILNVYQAERANPSEDAQAIGNAWENSVFPSILAWQPNGIVNIEQRIFNLGDPLDFGTFSLGSAAGVRAGAQSPSFAAGEIRFPSLNRSVRAGFKRYAGVMEVDDTNGVLVAAAITLLETIGTNLVSNWLASSDSHHVANYVVIKRICTSTPPPGDPCPQYRLPEMGDPLTFYTPTSRVVPTTTRSQVSRRPPA